MFYLVSHRKRKTATVDYKNHKGPLTGRAFTLRRFGASMYWRRTVGGVTGSLANPMLCITGGVVTGSSSNQTSAGLFQTLTVNMSRDVGLSVARIRLFISIGY